MALEQAIELSGRRSVWLRCGASGGEGARLLQLAASFQAFGLISEPPVKVLVPLITPADAGPASASRTAQVARALVS